jgi:hypothetical protein
MQDVMDGRDVRQDYIGRVEEKGVLSHRIFNGTRVKSHLRGNRSQPRAGQGHHFGGGLDKVNCGTRVSMQYFHRRQARTTAIVDKNERL